MCGRYRLSRAQVFAEINELMLDGEPLPERYNVAPTQRMPVVLDESPDRFSMLRWGLVPWWAKDLSEGARCINARSESVDTKQSFREAFKKRHCLVPADGFHEW